MPDSRNAVPFVDLHKQYLSIKTELDCAIADVIEKSAFVRGPFVDQFEQDFAAAIGVSSCVSCANGTDALYIAMMALRVQPGDEVIVPAMSWISTSETVSQAGAKVIFCDIDPVTYTLDAGQLKDKITSRTVGVIPVHLYGQPADMQSIMKIAAENNIWVLEDCAQSHLAEFNGQAVGTFGIASTFSFYPGKNLGAMGDAGAIITNDEVMRDRMAMFARHGGLKKGDHQIEGINSRLDGLQAAVLSVKLKHLQSWTRNRRELAAQYSELLQPLSEVKLPQVLSGRDPVWHLYVICHEHRNDMAMFLNARGIQTSINYPRALPFLPCYAHLNHQKAEFPVASNLANRCLSLPIYPEISPEQQLLVVDAIREFTYDFPT